jgi:ATP-dependent Clp protease ATP-binding subunit ClpA
MTSPDEPAGHPHIAVTGRAERVLRRAREEQQRAGHPHVTAEHILHGLLADKLCVAQFVLRELNVDARRLHDRVHAELEQRVPAPMVGEEEVLRRARVWVERLDQVSVGTEHLLLALIDCGSPAARWLADAGVREAEARDATERLIEIVPRRSGPGFRESGETEAQT